MVLSRFVGFAVPSDACGNLPCPHLGARRLELRLDCENFSICFGFFVADCGFGLRGIEIAVFTRVTKDGISV